ncbi:hypothetical protein [Raoultibacter phocaeensis]|uniref:hypothetical protein n=1 Tax=Raoultibacter phocaeensis TaxID=2479841 RepID=UPI001118B09B|nr:hypothetical protein [Raoultibacter phocaeensis]
MENAENKEVVVKGLIPIGNVGGGLGFGYASLCVAFAANAFGFCFADGFAIAIGVVLLGFFVIYLVGGLYFLKQGNTLVGSIYIAFSVAFGLYGGAVNIAGTICAALGIPCDFTIAAFANLLGGAYLLLLLPAMKGFSKVDFICFLFSGIGVFSFGLAGLGFAPFSMVGGASLAVAAATAYYGSVTTCYASVGKQLPVGKPFF